MYISFSAFLIILYVISCVEENHERDIQAQELIDQLNRGCDNDGNWIK